MSYCRWSSDDFACDLYIYEDVAGGFTIHIAGNRVVGETPRVAWPTGGPNDGEQIERFVTTHHDQLEFLKTAEREPIALPHAGETIHTATAGECADACERLAALGYRFPADVITTLRTEDAEGAGGPNGV